MSTKKLQIVTPIVTSVNGETGDVTLNSVQYTAQSLTDAQKAQARENIGAEEQIPKLRKVTLHCPSVLATTGKDTEFNLWIEKGNVTEYEDGASQDIQGAFKTLWLFFSDSGSMSASQWEAPKKIVKQLVSAIEAGLITFEDSYFICHSKGKGRNSELRIINSGSKYGFNIEFFNGDTGKWTYTPSTDSFGDYDYFMALVKSTTDPNYSNQTINQYDVKANPTTDMQIATKKYVDDGLAGKASKDVATTSANGLMSSTDKIKLNGIAEGANKTTVDTALSTTSTNPVQNKVVKVALDGKASSSHTHDEYLSHPIQLQENTDYGATLPSSPTNGRLFFQETSVTSLIDLVYPVGAVYISMNQTSPQTLFGGTWTQIQGRFLIGAGTAYPAGSTGGEATHTLTASEIPDHTHTFKYTGQSVTTGVNSIRLYQAASNQYNAYSGGQSSNCGGQAHNNLPPYMAVYMWTRTA